MSTPIPVSRSPMRTLVLSLAMLFLYGPILILVIYSFNSSRLVTVWAGFSTKWYGELFQDSSTLDLMLEPVLSDQPQVCEGCHYGRGMLHKQDLLSHGGQAFGYQSDVGYLPEEETTIVIWSNSSTNQVGQAAVNIARTLGLIEIEQ